MKTAPGPSGGTAGVPGVRADGLRGLAGRGRGYPRISSGSDTFGDTIPASGRYSRKKIEMVGFSSPKAGMGEITMKRLAKARNLKLPKTKAEAAEVLVRALAIEKLQQDDPNTSKFYEDKKSGGSSTD